MKPLWKGPEEDGITQSLLSRFIVCRERFRVLVLEGLRPPEQFNHRIEYGSMWHCCEEAVAKYPKTWDFGLLADYCTKLCKMYPLQQQQVVHWMNICKAQFPVAVKYWQKHRATVKTKPLYQEQLFKVPYELPSGRVVQLRGKWDSVDIAAGKKLWLQENKTKSDIDETKIQRQLLFDLQTMFYTVALEQDMNQRVTGVRYNVVRRPLSGGKHTIRQLKPTKANPCGESEEEFLQRLSALIASEPEYFFMRWECLITKTDVEAFKRQFLNPILEQLCDWWESMEAVEFDPNRAYELLGDGYAFHWRLPYGVYNVLLEGGSTEYDEYLATGNALGLEQVHTLFRELEV